MRPGEEPITVEVRQNELVQAISSGVEVPAGRLLGLPELDEDDVWVDIAGASAYVGAAPKTITSWLARRGPKYAPFPAPLRLLHRLYWRRSDVQAWVDQGVASGPPADRL